MKISFNEKNELVKNVFDKVFDKYDLINDILSLGSHRLWKKQIQISRYIRIRLSYRSRGSCILLSR